MKSLSVNFNDIDKMASYAKALSSEDRIKILKITANSNPTVNELAETLSIPISTTAMHVKVLEECGLILTRLEPAVRGTKKVCFRNVDDIFIDLNLQAEEDKHRCHYINMPIGSYVNCEINGTCGMANENSHIGMLDNPQTFYYPDHYTAQIIWFEQGFLEYRFPLDILSFGDLTSLDLSFECCSEAPSYNSYWPSDITVWMNDVELHTWTSPGDFGGRSGKLNPVWWPHSSTQYGLLRSYKIDNTGTYCDEVLVSSITLKDLDVTKAPYLAVKIGIKEDAENSRGINIFGEKFGDHSQSILLGIEYNSKI